MVALSGVLTSVLEKASRCSVLHIKIPNEFEGVQDELALVFFVCKTLGILTKL